MQADDHRTAALHSWQAGDVTGAIAQLHDGVRLTPGDSTLRITLAEYLWASYEFDEALQNYTLAADADPANSMLFVQVAQKLFSLGHFAPAVAWLEKASARAPADAAIRTMLGEVCERCDRLDHAERYAHEALGLDPAHPKAIRLLAHVQRRRGELPAARDFLLQQLRRSPGAEDWRLRYELAAVLDRLGEYDDAMRELILAKAQLRPFAARFVEAARAVRARQLEIAQQLTKSALATWATAINSVREPMRLAILCGHPRSGTTLLEQLLAAHPDVISTDETGVWQREFLDPIIREAASATDAVRELNGFDAGQLETGRRSYLRFTEAHLGEAVGPRVLIEKDPSLTPDLPLPLRLFPETKTIFPIRDPRDICISYFFTIIPLNRISVHAIDLAATCEFCAHSFRLWRHWREVLPGPKLETHYEQLVADPPREMRRVLEFLGLDWDERVLRFHERSFSKGVRTPTYADVAQPIYTRSIGRWKNYARHLEPHLELLEPVLREYYHV
jgi:Flp pilus assembly protein TadD